MRLTRPLHLAEPRADYRVRLRAGLIAAVSALALGACVTGPSPEEIHQMDWQTAARTDTPQGYQAYLRLYPAGQYAPIASARVDELSRIEADAFAVARRADTEAAYDDFLARYPWGRNAPEADGLRATRAAPRLAKQELADWTEARRVDEIEIY